MWCLSVPLFEDTSHHRLISSFTLGQCDLVLLKNEKYANGLGLSIHIRTKVETWWSYIQAAVVKIGKHTFELKGDTNGAGPYYWINQVSGNKDKMEEEFKTAQEEMNALLPCFKIHYKHVSSKQHKFRIELNCKGDAVSVQSYKDWISVNVKANTAAFNGTLGLMGEHPTGKLLGRDGKSVFDMAETDAFGLEWQVLKSEPMLFHTAEGTVQHPQKCLMPSLEASAGRKGRRRLGESLVTKEAAEIACEHAGEDKLACTYDVLASNDLDMAGAY